jgi:NurA-like 5'-3' nuclease
LLKDGPELAQHLSWNERDHIYGETSEELLLLKVRPFLELEEESEEWEDMLKEVLKSDLTVSQEAQKIVGTKHTLLYVIALMHIGNHFFHVTEMKTATIARELFNICGGVSVYIYMVLCRLTRGC